MFYSKHFFKNYQQLVSTEKNDDIQRGVENKFKQRDNMVLE